MIFLIKRDGFCRRIMLFVLLVSFILLSSHICASTSTGVPTLELLDNGRLTLNAQGVALGTLLAEINQRTKLEYEIHKKYLEQPITVSFRSLSLEEAIRRILHGISYACIFDSHGNVEKIVTVFDTGRANKSLFRRSSQGGDIPYGVAVEPHPEEINGTKDAVDAEPKTPPEVLAALEDTEYTREVEPSSEVFEALKDAMNFEPPAEILEAIKEAMEFKPSPEIIEPTEGIVEVVPSPQTEDLLKTIKGMRRVPSPEMETP